MVHREPVSAQRIDISCCQSPTFPNELSFRQCLLRMSFTQALDLVQIGHNHRSGPQQLDVPGE